MKGIAAWFLLVPLLLTGCVVPYGGSEATDAPTVTAPDGYSTLDPSGVAQIKASKVARLDMTSGQLTKESVGLKDGTSHAPDVQISDGTMSLDIEGPQGSISARTDRLRLNGLNKGAVFNEVTYFLKANSMEDYIALIRDGVDRYGIPHDSAERWIESTSRSPEDRSDFALEAGTSTGLHVTYDLRYDGSKNAQVIIVHVNPMRHHEP